MLRILWMLSIPFMGYKQKYIDIIERIIEIFQFPLWDTCNMYSLNITISCCFQFPLWDTWAKRRSSGIGRFIFQFPLWDTNWKTCGKAYWKALSIPFMGYESRNWIIPSLAFSILSIPFMGYVKTYVQAYWKDFDTFNSLYGILSLKLC